MRFAPRSLSRRLIFGAAIFVVASLVVSAMIIGTILHRFVQVQIDQRLDSQSAAIASALEIGADGRPALSHAVDGPPFNHFRSGWYWQVFPSDPPLRSWSLTGDNLPQPPDRPNGPGWPWDLFGGPTIFQGVGPGGERLRLHAQTRQVGAHSVVIVTAAPQAAVYGPLGHALFTLLTALAVLGLTLVGAIVLQMRLGLRPLGRLRESLRDVRAGRAERLPADQPAEIAPLVAEVNVLLDQNAERLSRARRNAANLAHGLKTPLSTLAITLEEPGRDPDGSLRALAAQMDRQIRHHLRRARAAATGEGSRSRTELAPRVADLLSALAKIYGEKDIAVETEIGARVALACDPQDLDEMLGNLLDNALKWAAGRVRVSAVDGETATTIAIEDDGAGLPPDMAAVALAPGRRLDESAPGYGFGLPITRELAELYGGGLGLSVSPMGGLKAALTLPSAA